jgi:hypothetical protein
MEEKNTKEEPMEPISLLDLMEEGKEYESLSRYTLPIEDIEHDVQRAVAEIKTVRKREIITSLAMW